MNYIKNMIQYVIMSSAQNTTKSLTNPKFISKYKRLMLTGHTLFLMINLDDP